VRPYLECFIQVWGPQHKKDVDPEEGHQNDQRAAALPL